MVISKLVLLALILKAPEGVDRWEPSGAAVIGDHLWIASDRGGHIARYRLPLQPVNLPDVAHALRPHPGQVKWEGLAAHGEVLYLLEAYSRQVWRCAAPEAGCPDLQPATPIAARWAKVIGAPTPYLGLEALSVDQAGALWTGSRGWVIDGRFEPQPRLLGPTRGWRWAPPMIDGHPLGLSGAAHGEGALWTTWSLEIEASEGALNGLSLRAEVAGLLARAPITNGVIGPARVVARFSAKPEGVALWGTRVIVVFDEDMRRKGRWGGFHLSPAEDYAVVLAVEGG
ncbi:hypothetical protein KKB55_17420 [Myxococcota bacterium]|nr:hypothetical protein [Myxococcota bacterium]MBU1899525.1 hypothetical protein [Myxococcota bacterium]